MICWCACEHLSAYCRHIFTDSTFSIFVNILWCTFIWPAACGWRQRWSSALWCACARRCDCLCTGQAYSSLQTPPSFPLVPCGSQTVESSSRHPGGRINTILRVAKKQNSWNRNRGVGMERQRYSVVLYIWHLKGVMFGFWNIFTSCFEMKLPKRKNVLK